MISSSRASEEVIPAIRSEKERQEAHPVFAAYMDMRYSRNMARDEAREKVIPAYMGLITQIDDQIGVLMKFLEERVLMDDTMIVFTSDHGSSRSPSPDGTSLRGIPGKQNRPGDDYGHDRVRRHPRPRWLAASGHS